MSKGSTTIVPPSTINNYTPSVTLESGISSRGISVVKAGRIVTLYFCFDCAVAKSNTDKVFTLNDYQPTVQCTGIASRGSNTSSLLMILPSGTVRLVGDMGVGTYYFLTMTYICSY